LVSKRTLQSRLSGRYYGNEKRPIIISNIGGVIARILGGCNCELYQKIFALLKKQIRALEKAWKNQLDM
jgi:hypothetical protein